MGISAILERNEKYWRRYVPLAHGAAFYYTGMCGARAGARRCGRMNRQF